MESEGKQYTKKCPFCAEEIVLEAKKCKHCGEYLDPVLLKSVNSDFEKKRGWNPGIAAVLSLIIPGAGQIYKGRVSVGILWLFVVVAGYALFVIPGLILHIICIVKAYRSNPKDE